MSENLTYVPGRLTSAKPDKTITGANEILDDDLHLKQNAINVLTKKVVTLNSAPTSSTLTYTVGNVTCNFAIGDEVRVEDSEQGDAETNNYIYYKLFDIDNNVAYWDLVGSGAGGGTGQIGELVSISLLTNQNDNSDLIGANIKVFNTDDTSEVFLETTWQGNPVEVEIQVPINYTVQVGNVNGYSTPAVQTYSSRTIRTRNVTFQYNTEIVTVTVNTNTSGVTAEGQVVTINGVNTTVPASGVVTQKVAYGTNYSVSVNNKSGYDSPVSQSFTANSVSRNITMTYTMIASGVYAVTTTGNLVSYSNINTSSPSSYVGVAVVDNSKNIKFIIDKRFTAGSSESSSVSNYKRLRKGLETIDIPGVSNINTTIARDSISAEARTLAFNDYNNGGTGVNNTDRIMTTSGASGDNASNSAANYCRSIANPISGLYNGYLPSLAECIEVYDNIAAINQILNAIGGVQFNYNNAEYTNYGATFTMLYGSTEYTFTGATSIAHVWGMVMHSNVNNVVLYIGQIAKNGGDKYFCTRVFFPF